MNFALAWMPEVLTAAGLNVVEHPGWETRGHGDMGSVLGVLLHHTAGPLTGDAPSLGVVMNGRVGLFGPLAHVVLSRSGVYHIVAAGLCYHAGFGEGFGLPTNDANPHLIGIEAENTGLANDPWPQVQMDAYARGSAAFLDKIGAKVGMCIGHKEWAPTRKIDPSFDCDAFRESVATHMG